MSIWIFFRLIGALALLMFGMKSMSDSLQKMAGPQLRHVLGTMTTNRLTGILSGTLITAAVQSSTATTVMTVSFVNAGLLTLAQAISVIMGANIGTTLTAWIMSAGFSFNITDFVWPAFFLAIILIYSKKRKIVGDFIFGISFMFLGLGTLRQTGIDMDLAHNQPVLDFFASFDPLHRQRNQAVLCACRFPHHLQHLQHLHPGMVYSTVREIGVQDHPS